MSKTRVKWFLLPIDRPKLRALADAMSAKPYTAKRGHGFVLSEVRATSISGRHVERTEREITGVDPHGEELKQTLIVYVHTSFTVSTSAPGLEVLDAPRSTKMLLGQISALSKFDLTVTGLDADPLVWLGRIEKEKLRAKVKELEYTDIAFRGGTTGMLTIRGKEDVRDAGQKIVGERQKQVHRVDVIVESESLPRTEITLERHGKAQVPTEVLADLRNVLRSALLATTEA